MSSELKICERMCDQCLYSKNKIVGDARRDEILRNLGNGDDYFICHKASIVNEKVMCRGYYEANKDSSLLIILGRHLSTIRFVDVLQVMKEGVNRMRSKVKN
jgi:hypothetical protein